MATVIITGPETLSVALAQKATKLTKDEWHDGVITTGTAQQQVSIKVVESFAGSADILLFEEPGGGLVDFYRAVMEEDGITVSMTRR